MTNSYTERLAQGRGRVILTSSGANEISHEFDKYGHGIFTYYLLRGLTGEADLDGDKLVSVDEVSLYLKKTVRKATNGAQNPVKKGDSQGLLIMGRISE